MSTRILLADDHQIFREGLASLLERQMDMDVIQQASDGLQAVSFSRDLKPDVVLLLAWNFRDEILGQIQAEHGWTGEVIAPLPGNPTGMDFA